MRLQLSLAVMDVVVLTLAVSGRIFRAGGGVIEAGV